MSKARLLLLNVTDAGGFKEVECDGLQDYYDNLKCDCFDIATRKIGDKYFDIFCDDVGLFVDNPIPSAIDDEENVMLVGNLIFANHDAQGNTVSLSDDDIELIKSNAHVAVTEDNTWIVVEVSY